MTRRTKCDQQTPCGSCSRKGKAASCSYLNDCNRSEGARSSEAHSRLRRLEDMVARLVHDANVNQNDRIEPHELPLIEDRMDLPTADGFSTRYTSAGSTSEFDNSAKSYHGASHWSTILSDVGLIIVEQEYGRPTDLSRSATFRAFFCMMPKVSKRYRH